jgi:hypothetical protein
MLYTKARQVLVETMPVSTVDYILRSVTELRLP